MTPFNRKQIFSNARSKLKQSAKLQGIIRKLSIRRHRGRDEADFNDAADNDYLSSIDNLISSADSRTTIANSDSAKNHAPKVRIKDGVIPRPGSSQQQITGLLLLPQELFDNITSYLDHANIICLALTNKELMSRFMNSWAKLEPTGSDESPSYKALNAFIKKSGSSRSKIRGALLSLLDYDLLDLVYCYKCKKLHDPFLTFKDRAYALHKAARCTDWSMEHHMPSRATRKMLRTITKRRIHGAEYKHLIQQVNNTQTAYHKGIMVQVSLRLRYRDDNMILRRQQVVSSIDKSALALWLFGQMLLEPPPLAVSALSLPKTYMICNHQNWDSIYLPMIQKWLQPFCKSNHTGGYGSRHTLACFSSEGPDVSKKEGHMIWERLKWVASGAKWNPTEAHTLLGDVLGCNKCTTDFCVDVVPLPEPFNWGFVLTTWLDLGKLDFCSKWDSHRDARPCREVKRQSPYGGICVRFEDLDSKLDYRPQISKLDLERMHNYGWGARVAKGKDKYMNWSLGHTCNPATGWFEDPDPLEEADY